MCFIADFLFSMSVHLFLCLSIWVLIFNRFTLMDSLSLSLYFWNRDLFWNNQGLGVGKFILGGGFFAPSPIINIPLNFCLYSWFPYFFFSSISSSPFFNFFFIAEGLTLSKLPNGGRYRFVTLPTWRRLWRSVWQSPLRFRSWRRSAALPCPLDRTYF
mgnify:CR=1 FL=1